jgi:hypothetical protein
MLKAHAEVEDSVKCGHDYSDGSSAHVQCMAHLDALSDARAAASATRH